jgi:hypothetical protein
VPDPNVGDLVPAKLDELVGRAASLLEEIRAVTEQLHPERARSCRNAITIASVMIDEIRLRARPPARRGAGRHRQLTQPVWCRPSAYGSRGGVAFWRCVKEP